MSEPDGVYPFSIMRGTMSLFKLYEYSASDLHADDSLYFSVTHTSTQKEFSTAWNESRIKEYWKSFLLLFDTKRESDD